VQTPDRRRVVVYLTALVGREPAGLLEMRWRHDDGMRRRFYRAADELPAAAAAIIQHGARTDVYVGCAPRAERAGGLDAIARVGAVGRLRHRGVDRRAAGVPAGAGDRRSVGHYS
jgi:hypothetical protein